MIWIDKTRGEGTGVSDSVRTVSYTHLVSEQDLEALFGKGAALTNKKDLSQPGQFACAEKVEVIGPKGSMSMSILGPTRPETQVEISLTDARKLGVTPPIRESGDLEGTTGCVLKGLSLIHISLNRLKNSAVQWLNLPPVFQR